MSEVSDPPPEGVSFRMLEPGEGSVLGEAIRAAYGDSYDAAWVYDRAEVGRRLGDGTYVSCVAEGAGRRAALPRRPRRATRRPTGSGTRGRR